MLTPAPSANAPVSRPPILASERVSANVAPQPADPTTPEAEKKVLQKTEWNCELSRQSFIKHNSSWFTSDITFASGHTFVAPVRSGGSSAACWVDAVAALVAAAPVDSVESGRAIVAPENAPANVAAAHAVVAAAVVPAAAALVAAAAAVVAAAVVVAADWLVAVAADSALEPAPPEAEKSTKFYK